MMLVPVLTAVSDAVWEERLVAALSRGDLGVAVVRRCVDLADLLATASTGQARAVLLSADLRRLDREALTRLAVAGVAVVGLVPPGDEDAERRLRQLGVTAVLPSDASAETISAAVIEAVVALSPAPSDLSALADPRAALPVVPSPAEELETLPGAGRLVAVWGPTGAPGRTTVAVSLACELAALGWPALLVDADVYGGVVAQVLGLLDESPGLAAACRQANNGLLDVPALAGFAREVATDLRVLTGIARADRWPELRPSALKAVLTLARSLAAMIVVDCGFALEQDEELAYDTMAPRRNGATLAVLEQADTVVVVGAADPVGLQRLVRGLSELKEAVPGIVPTVVVNRLRSSAIPGDAESEVRTALKRYAGVETLTIVPQDVEALDAALALGRTLTEAAPGSLARQAIQGLAASLVGVPAPARKRRLLRR
ncbi:MAG: CpaE family protein [Mycobacteriales bacterium]